MTYVRFNITLQNFLSNISTSANIREEIINLESTCQVIEIQSDRVTRSTNCMILMTTTSTMNGMPVMTSTVS